MATQDFDFTDFIGDRVPVGTPAPPRADRAKYDFGTGFPDPDSFPSEGLHKALGRALKDHGRDMVLYPDPQGFLPFREFIANKLDQERGINVDPDQVLLTGGSGVALAIVSLNGAAWRSGPIQMFRMVGFIFPCVVFLFAARKDWASRILIWSIPLLSVIGPIWMWTARIQR